MLMVLDSCKIIIFAMKMLLREVEALWLGWGGRGLQTASERDAVEAICAIAVHHLQGTVEENGNPKNEREKNPLLLSQEIDFLCFFGTVAGGYVGKSP